MPRRLFPILLIFPSLFLAPAGGPAHPAEDPKAAAKALSRAATEADPEGFLSAIRAVLERGDAAAVRAAAGAYAQIAPIIAKKLSSRELLHLHGKSAAAFAGLRKKEAVDELKKLLTKARDWQSRLLLLDASAFTKGVNHAESCLAALDDPHPVVLRRALHYLVRAKKVPVVESIVKRFNDLAVKKARDPDPQWARTLLAFQSTLQQMLRVDLPAAIDYQNYFEAHKADPDIFDPKSAREGQRTGATLFGTAVTGKNIVFILDVSGSMLTTDPLPGEEERTKRPRTVVVGGPKEAKKKEEEPPSERQRMLRAKRELVKVVRALPEGVRFNLVAYSSDVNPWQKTLVPSTDANKKGAAEYVESLKADGVTVTDMAIEEAFSHIEVDTIYLVTDGVPTHVGSGTPALPEDSAALIREIHRRVEELNFLRGVRIFTLGFEQAEEDFLKKLAADNAGTYVRIQ